MSKITDMLKAWTAGTLGGGGGSSNAGDRAALHASVLDVGTNLYTLILDSPQPDAAAVPTDWSIVDGGLMVPAGTYWISGSLTFTATETGQAGVGAWFYEDVWNGDGAWGTQRSGEPGTIQANDTLDYGVTMQGVIHSAAPDRIVIGPTAQAAISGASPQATLYVTRIA